MMLKINTLLIVVLIASCKYDDQYVGDPTPIISNISVNNTQFKQFLDTVVIGFDYTDGDGDLGFLSADSLSIEVKDIRFSQPDYYHLPPMSPEGAKIRIKGRLVVTMKNVFLLGSANTESTKFQIRIKDRSQKWSNLLLSKSIIINK